MSVTALKSATTVPHTKTNNLRDSTKLVAEHAPSLLQEIGKHMPHERQSLMNIEAAQTSNVFAAALLASTNKMGPTLNAEAEAKQAGPHVPAKKPHMGTFNPTLTKG